jgi:uncharacterized protein (TIGR02145 family)
VVAVSLDLLDLLPYYGGEFTVDEILIDGVTLVEYLTQVSVLLDEQSDEIEALQDAILSIQQQEPNETTIINNYGSMDPNLVSGLQELLAANGQCTHGGIELLLSGVIGRLTSNGCYRNSFFGSNDPVAICTGAVQSMHSDFSNSQWIIPSDFAEGASGPIGNVTIYNSTFSHSNFDNFILGSEENITVLENPLILYGNGGFDYCSYRFSGSNFFSVSAVGAEFRAANFEGSNFQEADLTNTLFDHCNLQGVNFNYADLSCARIENSTLEQASFYGADTDGLSMTNIYLNNGCGDVEDLDGFECVQNGDGTYDFIPEVASDCSDWAECSNILFDGHYYETIRFGGNCWFAENLKTTTFSNGDSITNFSDGFYDAYGSYNSYGDCEFWLSDESGYWQTNGNSGNCGYSGDYCDIIWSNEGSAGTIPDGYDIDVWTETAGLNYNLSALYDERGICPTGWHPASVSDWKESLIAYLEFGTEYEVSPEFNGFNYATYTDNNGNPLLETRLSNLINQSTWPVNPIEAVCEDDWTLNYYANQYGIPGANSSGMNFQTTGLVQLAQCSGWDAWGSTLMFTYDPNSSILGSWSSNFMFLSLRNSSPYELQLEPSYHYGFHIHHSKSMPVRCVQDSE